MVFTERTEIVIKREGIERLAGATVALFGLGGVGAAAAVDLIRVGVGRLIVTDFDAVQETNLNRLIFGFTNTVGQSKVDVLKDTAARINPAAIVEGNASFMHGNDAAAHIPEADCYIDAIDSLNPKINLIMALLADKKAFISSMGTAGRLDPAQLAISNIWEISGCPLASMVRKRLRKRGILLPFQVVHSTESPADTADPQDTEHHDGKGRIRRTQGSTPFVPQAAGHMAASWVTRKLLGLL